MSSIRHYLSIATPLDKLLVLLASLLVFIDWGNGLLWHTFGSSFGFSASIKLLLLLLLIYRGWQLNRQALYWPLSLMLLMLPGPLYVLWLTGHHYGLADLQLISKSAALLVALAYFSELARQQPQAFLRWLDGVFAASFLLLFVNSLLGLAGYGGTAYQPMDEVAQPFLGVKGFFISTNELSGLLLVLSCWLLVRSWQALRWFYPLLSLAALSIAALLLTKTGLFGVLLLVLLIPILLTPSAYFYAKRQWLLGLSAIILGLLMLLLWNLSSVLQWVGIYDKLQFAYQQRGIMGIILSSRDYYLQRNFTLVAERYPEWLQLFGVGQGGLRLHLKKYFIELDLFDLLLFYGLAGGLLFALSFWRVFGLSAGALKKASAAGPVLLLNSLLLLVALLAGHVLTSGMLWLPWALINAALLAQQALPRALALTLLQTETGAADERSA
ncbi:hypothetical protein [Alishewanella sp. SMS8]|uniref:hypothetical protein n=1 Tax=Alishewanella sp. SMS8 TaxID=2994676 RepID=UPI002740DCFE|nr:hypothetical protein [Alishewanella sp. SMS8]MDP5460209.1 hypothetical protein [Alishewanella sp. SMS8]